MADRRIGVTIIKGKLHTRYKRPNGEIYLDPPEAAEELEKQAERMEEMIAYGQSPKISDDTTFQAGVPDLATQFANDPGGLEKLKADAKRRGIVLNGTELYMGNLANHPYDASACVSSKAQVKKACLDKGVPVLDGMVKVTEQEAKATKARDERDKATEEGKVAMAPELVNEKMKQVKKNRPDLVRTKKQQAEMRQKIVNTHGSKRKAKI